MPQVAFIVNCISLTCDVEIDDKRIRSSHDELQQAASSDLMWHQALLPTPVLLSSFLSVWPMLSSHPGEIFALGVINRGGKRRVRLSTLYWIGVCHGNTVAWRSGMPPFILTRWHNRPRMQDFVTRQLPCQSVPICILKQWLNGRAKNSVDWEILRNSLNEVR